MTDRADIEDLIARTALGERTAFSSLYDATSAKLFGVCLRVLKDRRDAEDALQDVYVRIWQKADRYAAGGYSAMTWLITLARNLAIDRLRARRPDADGLGEAAEIASSSPTPEAVAIAASQAYQLESCLGELKALHADAVRGAYLDGLTYHELAARSGVPLNTMRSWLRRSLIKLRECLSR